MLGSLLQSVIWRYRVPFGTNLPASSISMVGGSLRDVQILAGYSALSTTQRCIDADAVAQKRVVM
jgi:hypothetical protein